MSWCAGGMLASTLLVPGLARADEASDAAKIFEEADAAATKKDWPTCIAKSEEAWAKFQHAQIRGLQGKCEVELGKYKDGATHIAFYAKNSTSGIEPDFAESLKKAKEHVAEVTIEGSLPDAEITVDGAPVGKAPVTLFLDVGKHQFGAAAGGKQASMEYEAVAGTKPPAPVQVPFEKDAVPPPGGAKKSVPLIVVGSIFAVLGVGAGSAFIGLGMVARDDRDTALAKLEGENRCASGTPYVTECAQIISDDERYGNLTIAGATTLSIGAAVGIATLIYAVMPSSKPTAAATTTTTWAVVPVVTPELQGASFLGVF